MKHTSIFFFVVSLLFCSNSNLFAQQKQVHISIPSTGVDTIDYGVISAMSGVEDYSIWIHNPKNESLQYTIGLPDTNGFTTAPVLWFADSGYIATIAPNDSIRVYAILLPSFWKTTLSLDGTSLLWDGTSDQTLDIHVGILAKTLTDLPQKWTEVIHDIVYVHIPLDLDKGISLYQNQLVWNSLYGEDSLFYPLNSILYSNDQDSEVTIQKVFIPKGSCFSITGYSDSNFPVTLHKGDVFKVYLSFSDIPDTIGYTVFADANDSTVIDTGYYNLIVVITDTTYPVSKANYKGAQPKKELNQALVDLPKQHPADIFISNDPVTEGTRITLPQARSATIKIIDLLGVTVAQANATDWRWNGESRLSSRLTNGIYTVEADGISNQGKAFQASKNIILMR